MIPLISVIVPVYNSEKTLDRCLNSILNQTFSDFEIIIVNDGSFDNSIKVIQKFVEKDSRIKLINQVNKGLGAARNIGIKNAKGKYIACVDSDDYIDFEMLEKMYNSIELQKSDMAICQADNVLFEKGKFVKSLGAYIIPISENLISGQEAVKLQINYIIPILFNSVCFKLVKRSFFTEDNIWFPEGHRYAEDTPTSVGLMLNSKSISLVKENLYFYVHEGESLTSSYSLKKANDIYLDIQDIIRYIESYNYSGTVANFIQGMLFPMMKQILWSEKNTDTDKYEAKRLLEKLHDLRKENQYKPNFKGLDIPIIQKLKILCSYYNLTSVACFLIDKLKWIPFFRYMM